MVVSGNVDIASSLVESIVCGHHHMYARIFGAVFHMRNFNAIVKLAIHNLNAVSVIKPGTGVVCHISRRISTPCNLFT